MTSLLWIVFLFLHIKLNLSQKPPNNGPPRDYLRSACKDDIFTYCPGETGAWAYACLELHRLKLSPSCSQYIGSTVIGACDDDATRLCPDETKVTDILTCLHNHEASLSESCLVNIMNHNSVTSSWIIMQQHYKRVTKETSIISIIYLSIPMMLALWAIFKMRNLNLKQKLVMEEFTIASSSKSMSREISSNQSRQNLLSNQNNSMESEIETETDMLMHKTLDIGFMNISYWVKDYSMIGLTSKRNEPRQILKEVSGEFKNNSICAIMGPSGSGKTTLLKLLSGQLTTGEFSGYRYLNGKITSPQVYLQVIHSQGYVAQQDTFLESLTVWQTLVYAALLRIHDPILMEDKLRMAWKVMENMGLDNVAHTILSSEVHSDNNKGISGGQRRRLSIAQALLGNPQVLLLDEPTSGLDATSSLRLLKILHALSRKQKTTVALTIHQPRAEVFNLFDNLILLGSGGHLIYSGPSSAAALLISQCNSVSVNILNYDNPGDFIIDVLDATKEYDEDKNSKKKQGGVNLSSLSSFTHQYDSKTNITSIVKQMPNTLLKFSKDAIRSVTENSGKIADTFTKNKRNNNNNLGEYEMISLIDKDFPIHEENDDNDDDDDVSEEMNDPIIHPKRSSTTVIHSLSLLNDSINDSPTTSTSASTLTSDGDDSPIISQNSIKSLLPSSENQLNTTTNTNIATNRKIDANIELNNMYLLSEDYKKLISTYRIPKNDSQIIEAKSSWFLFSYCQSKSSLVANNVDETVKQIINSTKKSPTSPISQIWILFSRRIQVQWPSNIEFITFLFQICLVGFVTTYTFSYTVSTQLELPYQVLMILVMLSTYLMILQYLSLVPEYMSERKVILAENTANYLNFWSYIFSALLTEVPRAVCQSIFFIGMIYSIRPINPDPINHLFFVACLTVGVCAWQSQIAVCAVITDQMSYVYTLTFLVLGSGTLFGGLILRLSKIPALFKVFYFLSVSAVTQRALVVNDMECCYMTTTCNSLIKEMEGFDSHDNQLTTRSTKKSEESSSSRHSSHSSQYLSSQIFPFTIYEMNNPLTFTIHQLYSNIISRVEHWFIFQSIETVGREISHMEINNINIRNSNQYNDKQPTLRSLQNFNYNLNTNIDSDNNNIVLLSDINLKSSPISSQGDGIANASPSTICPSGLKFSGDGTDEGNLGRMYLKFMGLDHDFPFRSLLILFWINIIFRILAGAILCIRKKYRNQLRYKSSLSSISNKQMNK